MNTKQTNIKTKFAVIKRGSVLDKPIQSEAGIDETDKPRKTLKQSVTDFLFDGQTVNQVKARREARELRALAHFATGR